MCEAIANDDVPIEQLSRELAPGAVYAHNPFFRAAVSLQPTMPEVGLPWSVTTMDIDSGGSPWDLYAAFIDGVDGLGVRVQYNPNAIAAEQIEQGVRDFETLMTALITDPSQPILAGAKLTGAGIH
jgi:hypothetical protein